MDTYLVIGDISKRDTAMHTFETFEEAVDYIWKTDAMGLFWIRCPDGRWFNPHSGLWR